MKAYTDIEQSKKLAEILPIESANFHFSANLSPKGYLEKPIWGNSEYADYSAFPCWSFVPLLNALPSVITRKGKKMFLTLEKAGAYNLYYKAQDRLDELWETKEEPIDACVEMILKLHEEKLL